MTPASGFNKLAQNEQRWISYLDGIRARRAESLASLYDETSSFLYGLALRVLNDPVDAEEVVLDAYQQVWKSVDSFDPARGTILGWLMIITRSRAIDRLRSAGVTAYAGDFTYMPAGSTHEPLYTEDGCLLLIAYT